MSNIKVPSKGWHWDGHFPHCDHRIVHKPGECVYCDEYASMLQYIRQMWNINFTNYHIVETSEGTAMLPCPAEVARPLEVLNMWGGNVAKTQEMIDEQDKAMKEAFANIEIKP
jgi:hypothetical protein